MLIIYLDKTLGVTFTVSVVPETDITLPLKIRTAFSASGFVSYRTKQTPLDIPVSLHVKIRTEIILPAWPKNFLISSFTKDLGRPLT